MALRHVQPAIDIVSPKPQKIGLLEKLIAGVVFVFPIEGAFQPIGFYLAHQTIENLHNALYAPAPDFTADSIENTIALSIIVYLCITNWRAMLREARLMLPLIALFLWIFADSLWSIDPINSLRRGARMVDHVMFATYLVARFSWRELIAFLTCCSGVILIMSLAVMLIFPDLSHSFHGQYTGAWRGVFTEKNTLGAVAGMGVLISGYSLLTAANNRAFAAFVCVGQLLVLVMSRSATSVIALLAPLSLAVAAFAVFIHQRPVVRLFACMTLLLGAVAALILFLSYDSINDLMGRSDDLTGRIAIWHYVLKTIELRPWVGQGYGFWVITSDAKLDLWASMQWPMPHAHDEYLDVTLQLGVVGLCLEVFCLALGLMRAARFSFVLEDGKGLFCGLIIVSLCVRGYAETVLTDPTINGWVWLVIPFLTLAQMAKEKTSLPPYRVTA